MNKETTKIIYDLYKKAAWITESCPEQKKIFSHWSSNNTDPIYQSLAWDFETTGVTYGIPTYLHVGNTDIRVNNPTVFGISMCIIYKERFYLFWGRHNTDLFESMVDLLKIEGFKCGHNIKYDIRTARTNNIEVTPINNCTMTMARICWDRLKEFALQKLSEFLCPQISDWEEVVHRESKRIKSTYTRKGYPKGYTNYSFIDDNIMGKYSMTDSFVSQILNLRLYPEIEEKFKDLYERERETFGNIINSELRGIPFDRNKAKKHIRKFSQMELKLIKKTKTIVNNDEFNPKSPGQLKEALLATGVNRESIINKKGAVSTDAPTLEKLVKVSKNRKAIRLAETVIDIRSNAKILNSYLVPLSRRALHNNNIIYFTINPTDSRTGRMAGRDPNMQNIPRPKTGKIEKGNPVRSCFVCRPGYKFFFFDYEQMEMAMFGYYAKDERILKAYANGEDLHEYMTVQIYGKKAYDKDGKVNKEKRQKVKGVNFGVIYGMGVKGLAELLKVSIEEAREFHSIYMNEFPSIREAQIMTKKTLENQGYLEDPFGRHYHLEPSQAYKGVNAYIQGACAQVIKIAYNSCIKFVKKLSPLIYMLIPIHDEMMFEYQKKYIGKYEKEFVNGVRYRMEVIPRLMKDTFRLRVEVKYSENNWEDKISYKVG